MHPAFIWWWKNARRSGHGCGPRHVEESADEGVCVPPTFGGHRGPPNFSGHRGPPWARHGHGDDGPGMRFGGRFGHGPPGPHGPGHHGPPDEGIFGGGFGVRRPLRFLAHKLDLSEAQTSELARIIDELKTERAQAEVDHRRTVAAFADALEAPTFGADRAKEGGELRVKSAERLRDAVSTALQRIHGVLDDEQRKQFAYLVRTGVVTL